MKLSIIILVYNKANTIMEIIQRVQATGLADEILAIDNGSTDGSRELLERLSEDGIAKVIVHDKNQGRAVRTVTQNASGDLILIQDADLAYDLRKYPNLPTPSRKVLQMLFMGPGFLGLVACWCYFGIWLPIRF